MAETTEDERIACVRRYIGQDATDEQVAAARAGVWSNDAIDYATAMGG